jgi:hypothetical protein
MLQEQLADRHANCLGAAASHRRELVTNRDSSHFRQGRLGSQTNDPDRSSESSPTFAYSR